MKLKKNIFGMQQTKKVFHENAFIRNKLPKTVINRKAASTL